MNLNYNVAKINQLNAVLKGVIGQDTSKEIEKAQTEMLRLSKPRNWNVYTPNNAELEEDVGFESYLFLVGEHTGEDVNTMTVFRFCSLIDYIKNKK